MIRAEFIKRDNDIYWADYERQLEEAGIAPENELFDVLAILQELKEMPYYEELAEDVSTLFKIYEYGSVKIGRKKYTGEDTMNFICKPAIIMIEDQKKYELKEVEEDGITYVTRDVPEEKKAEYRILFWIYMEYQTIDRRMKERTAERAAGNH